MGNPNYPDTAITIEMLMRHTSSITDNWDKVVYYDGDPTLSNEEFCEQFLVPGGSLYVAGKSYGSWAPGTQYAYANVATGLLGYLVERLTNDGKKFDVYCNENIFEPLGMDHTGWFLSDFADLTKVALPLKDTC